MSDKVDIADQQNHCNCLYPEEIDVVLFISIHSTELLKVSHKRAIPSLEINAFNVGLQQSKRHCHGTNVEEYGLWQPNAFNR